MSVFVEVPGFPGYKVSKQSEVISERKLLVGKSRQLFLRVGGKQVAASRNGKLGKNSIQAIKVKQAWKNGTYKNRTLVRRAKHDGSYGKSNSKKLKIAWENGRYEHVDWGTSVRRGWEARRKSKE